MHTLQHLFRYTYVCLIAYPPITFRKFFLGFGTGRNVSSDVCFSMSSAENGEALVRQAIKCAWVKNNCLYNWGSIQNQCLENR